MNAAAINLKQNDPAREVRCVGSAFFALRNRSGASNTQPRRRRPAELGLALLAAQFPAAKGKATGIYYSAGSLSNFSISAHHGLWIARNLSIHNLFRFDVAIAAAVGVALSLFIAHRSRCAEIATGIRNAEKKIQAA